MEKKKKVAANRVKIMKGKSLKRGEESRLRKKKGGSSVGKYKKVGSSEFCGPSGGAPEGSYPVNSTKRCRAALAYAHNAPNPEGIKACVKKKCAGKIKKYSKK